jgi:hypothetical protein
MTEVFLQLYSEVKFLSSPNVIVYIKHLQVLVADINIGYEEIVNTQVTESSSSYLQNFCC